jgi:GH35 family endo-1,4-beta-xylanase
LAVRAGDAISQHTAESGWARRRQSGGFTRRVLGQAVDGRPPSEAYCKRLAAVADFAVLPFTWRLIEPAEQRFDWKVLDTWVEWLTKQRIPIRGSDLVCFSEQSLPDWIYIYEHDFEAIRDLIYEHVRRVISRYAPYVHGWDVVSGIHAHNSLSFSFEELLELTRMATAIARQLAPRNPLSIDLCAPWGEYYARNQRTIPPHLYADMVLQSGIQFDAFGLRLHFGVPRDGFFVRDMFQVSSIIDRFNIGKPLHISAVGVPSVTKSGTDSSAGQDGGDWHGPWTEAQQARWLREFYRIALAKPFVDTVTWRPFCDRDPYFLAHGGLLRADLSPKPAYEEILQVKASLGRGAARQAAKSS